MELSVVIPCYNESEVLPMLKARLVKVLENIASEWEVILIDDGSKDGTPNCIAAMHREDPRFKAIFFSRNFGHQTAISAGLAHATGEAVAIMDADLQDPPELFKSCLEKLHEGYDVVYAVRRKRKETFVKRICYALFYRVMQALAEMDVPLDTGDFCVMRAHVVRVLTNMPERHVFVRGLRAWAGFRQTGLEYERNARAAGKPKYSFWKLAKLAANGLFGFSILPLRVAIYVGFGGLACSIVAGMFILAWRIFGFRFMGHRAVELPGWTAAVGGMLFLAAIQFLILGFMGEYIGRIYTEVKQRPRWVIRETLGLRATEASELHASL